jgi:hypothetical protein
MQPRTVSLCLALYCAAVPVWADEYSVRKLDEAPPKEGLSTEIASQLAPTGVRVTRDSADYCDIWLCQSPAAVSGFQPTPEIAFPFTPGQLIGAVRFARRGSDFREQDIRSGVYTLRYAQQPVDGAHVGSSATRDFALLISAAQDKNPAVLDYKVLTKQSSDAARSSHPAILCLLAVPRDTAEFPSIRHEEVHDWWIVALRGETRSDGKVAALSLGVVVAGKSAEQ